MIETLAELEYHRATVVAENRAAFHRRSSQSTHLAESLDDT